VKVRRFKLSGLFLAVTALVLATVSESAGTVRIPELGRFLTDVAPADLAPGADAFGAIREDLPVAPILERGEVVGWAYLTSDFVGTTGYSGKPIHVLVGVSPEAVLTGVRLVEHSEPIVLIGIPDAKIQRLTTGYAGLDLRAEAAAGGSGHDLDIISGATVTIMVIDDSIVRSGLKVARALGLGGLAPKQVAAGPAHEVDMDFMAEMDWAALASDGSVRRLTLDIGQINAAFDASGDQRAAARPEVGDPAETYIDMQTALVSVPSIGRSLLGEAEYGNLVAELETGEHAILIAGRGRYSFKGSGYVRGGIFDRIQLIQGDISIRFRDRQHRRLGAIAAQGAPSFTEIDLFRIPADSGFDPTKPWRLQLLASRSVGAIEKSFLTFDLSYRTPARYLRVLQPAAQISVLTDSAEEAAAKAALWQRIWRDRSVEVGVLVAMLTVLTGIFFFQKQATRNARALYWIRIGYLMATLVYIGWYANAQLSVVNLMALGSALQTGFSWDAFLLDPLVFILWCSVAVALIFWGRGAYCGWLCPFGALQELTNQFAQALNVPQWELPWGLHERLWPIKYLIFLGLFGLSLASIPLAEQFAEVEPFKTAIVLKFQRAWPFVLFAVIVLGAGLFVERFYCRYLCPLGAALAIPARIRMFAWLKRYHECGHPCQTCSQECPVQAIHPTGEINPNECINCLHCQVLYQSEAKCPVIVRQLKRRKAFQDRNQGGSEAMAKALASRPDFQPKEKTHD
jgi:NosR/NirI family nitrous oxide reductase transcriptional regulator